MNGFEPLYRRIIDYTTAGQWSEVYDGPVEGCEEEKLRAENAKLRELVAKAHACKTDEGCCEDCYQDEGCCPIEREMQKLGIEVDDT